VKRIFRSLLVWLLLLALPFQGLASAGVLACAPADPSPAPAPAPAPAHHASAMAMRMAGQSHDHAAMPRAPSVQAASASTDGGHCAGAGHDGAHEDDHRAGKPGSCAACCIGAAMAPAALPALPLAPAHFISIPFHAGHVPSVDPVLPERPPRIALA
jgi:hypothetical protein